MLFYVRSPYFLFFLLQFSMNTISDSVEYYGDYRTFAFRHPNDLSERNCMISGTNMMDFYVVVPEDS